MKPTLIQGSHHKDDRGEIQYNNEFNATEIKRMYTIQNNTTDFVRAWQGHKIEKRWFTAIQGSFEIKLIQIDNWENPNKDSEILTYILETKSLHVLCTPNGYLNSIQAKEENSKLLAMSDYQLGEINDEYKFEPNFFSTPSKNCEDHFKKKSFESF
jgi:dTDP-4-dehydrorhamnose 3,5-epimerase-like enzyme